MLSEKYFNMTEVWNNWDNILSRRIVLFGAAKWGEVVLTELQEKGATNVVFADNNITKSGKLLAEKLIISANELSPTSDAVIITTISAGDSVSKQLEQLGFTRNETYFEVMHSLNADHPISVIDYYLTLVEAFKGLDVLHVGPGGHIGVELLLLALGARSVASVEYNSFGITYPDLSKVRFFYEELNDRTRARYGVDFFEQGLLKIEDTKLVAQTKRLNFLFPCSVTELPFEDNKFDLVLHHAVFEHVPNPSKGYEEIFRVLKPNGVTAGMVDPQDHRAQVKLEGLHPLKFLEMSRDKWYELSSKINFHNQITTPEHREYIENCGFTISHWKALKTMQIDDSLFNTFHSYFHQFDKSSLETLRFEFLATKFT